MPWINVIMVHIGKIVFHTEFVKCYLPEELYHSDCLVAELCLILVFYSYWLYYFSQYVWYFLQYFQDCGYILSHLCLYECLLDQDHFWVKTGCKSSYLLSLIHWNVSQPPSPLCKIIPNRIYTSLITESQAIAITILFWSFLFLLFLEVFFLFLLEVFALLLLLSLTVLLISGDKTWLAFRTFSEFSDNNSKLFEVKICLVNVALIFDANLLDTVKGSVWTIVFFSNLPEFTVLWITFQFSSKIWIMQFLVWLS